MRGAVRAVRAGDGGGGARGAAGGLAEGGGGGARLSVIRLMFLWICRRGVDAAVMVARWHEDRVKAALGTAALAVLVAYALLTGLAVECRPRSASGCRCSRSRRRTADAGRAGRAAADASDGRQADRRPICGRGRPRSSRRRRSSARLPPPVVAAPVPDLGGDRSAGDADVPGLVTGRGGEGPDWDRPGNDDGDDAGGGMPPRWLRGGSATATIRAGPAKPGSAARVGALPGRDRRPGGDCAATGRAAARARRAHLPADRAALPLRAVARPDGRAVRSIIVEDHSWMVAGRRQPRSR